MKIYFNPIPSMGRHFT